MKDFSFHQTSPFEKGEYSPYCVLFQLSTLKIHWLPVRCIYVDVKFDISKYSVIFIWKSILLLLLITFFFFQMNSSNNLQLIEFYLSNVLTD